MDISDVDRVVQYMIPSSLSVWIQRLGRAGRSGRPAIVIILVEPSVFKTRKPKGVAPSKKRKKGQGDEVLDDMDEDLDVSDEDSDSDEGEEEVSLAAASAGPREYVKKVEDGMRKWVETKTCRRKVADEYFNNPPRREGTSLVPHETSTYGRFIQR